MAAWEADVMAEVDGEQYALRMHSLPDSAADATAAADRAARAAADRLIEGEADLRKKAVYMDLKALLLSKVVQE